MLRLQCELRHIPETEFDAILPNMDQNIQKALSRALYHMLRPMVRLLLRHGVTYRLFADVARHVYVDVAMEDFEIPGRKPSYSRVAILTGINRKDIAKLKERPHPLRDGAAPARSPSARIIDGWMSDRRFQDELGRAAPLAVDSGSRSFAALVAEYATDVPVRAVLDELVRINAVERIDDKVHLVTQGYIPHQDVEQKIRILGTAATDLLSTLDYNLSDDQPGTYLQRTVSYCNIPAELAERIRDRSRSEGEAFLLQINDWLARYDRVSNPDLAGSGRVRAGIGIYYFEHPSDEVPETQDTGAERNDS